MDLPGHVAALQVGPADVDDRAEVSRLTAEVQAATQDSVELALSKRAIPAPSLLRRRAPTASRWRW